MPDEVEELELSYDGSESSVTKESVDPDSSEETELSETIARDEAISARSDAENFGFR